MNQLINITENNGNKAVSARELYQYLGYNASQWKRWYEKNISKNEFAIENFDYQTLDIMSNGNATKDFSLSIDFAKRIAMMARTEKGEEIRNYFIAIEKKATQPQPAELDKNLQHHTLLALLKQNLKRGDMKDIAQENGFSYDAVRNIFYASSRRPDVIQAIFEKALANKKTAGNPQDMINQLK